MPKFCFLVAACAALVTPVLAADPPSKKNTPPVPPAETKPDLTLDIGAGTIFAPKFPGAKDNKIIPIPFFALNYKDIVFASIRDGIGANLVNSNGFKAGPLLKVALPRRERDSRRYLTGLGDVDATFEAGGFVEYAVAPFFSTKLEVRKGSASFGGSRNRSLAAIGINRKSEGHDGVIADWSADFGLPPLLNDRLFVSVGPRASYFDKDYAQTYFGVTPGQSRVSKYAAFKPKAGIGQAGAGALAVYRITDTTSLTAFADYTRLVGEVAKSPLVRGRGGSRDQFSAGTAITYRFSL